MSILLKHHEREQLIWDSALSGNEKLLALALNSFIDGNGECFPGQDTLAEMCGLKVRTIRNLCKSLEAKQVISRHHRYKGDGNRTSDKYKLSFSALAENFAGSVPEDFTGSLAEDFAGKDGERDSDLAEDFSPSALPETDDTTTGNSRHDYRQMTTSLPATDSGDLSRRTIQKNYPEDLSSYTPPPPLRVDGGCGRIFSQAESNRPNPQDSPSGPSEPDSNPQSSYTTVTVEPIAEHQLLVTGSDSGEDTGSAPAKKTRKKKKNCDVRHARGSNSAYYPTEALDLFELWKPMYSALRGGSDSRAGFMQGFDALIEQDIPVADIIEGTCFYIHDKMQRLGRGKNPTVPPDAIRFFKGSRDHPSSYCLDALEHKHAQESRTLTPHQQAVMAIATETPPKILELQRKELERRRRIEERERESREQNRLFWTHPPQH